MPNVASIQQPTRTLGAGTGNGYVVKPGDTLSGIAASHGVSLAALERANPQILHPDLIRSGQHVTIPSGSETAAHSYTVRSGDTLSAIGEHHGLSAGELARRNGIADPDLILPGQVLDVSGGGRGIGGSGQIEGSNSVGGTHAAGSGSGDIAATAEKYLNRNASSLKADRSDSLPMNANVPSDVCCANFVSAVLTESGHLPANLHTDSVAQLNTTLRHQGWTPVTAAEAKPGDVVIIQSHGISHTEIVSGPGQMIGSNNRNTDGSQRVTHGNLSWATQNGGVILRAPGGGGSSKTGGTRAPSALPPSGDGTRSQRVDQALRYFESQGWSKAQAAGIVANLDAESGMNAGIRQIGGGPGYGLAQWEGPRQRDFAAWAGHDIHGSSFAEQLRFVQHELTGTNASAGRALRGTSDARHAGEIVTRLYERPADTEGQAAARGGRAVSIYNSH